MENQKVQFKFTSNAEISNFKKQKTFSTINFS